MAANQPHMVRLVLHSSVVFSSLAPSAPETRLGKLMSSWRHFSWWGARGGRTRSCDALLIAVSELLSIGCAPALRSQFNLGAQQISVVVGSGHKTNSVEHFQIEHLGTVHCYDLTYSLHTFEY